MLVASGDRALQQQWSPSNIRGYVLHEKIGEDAFAKVYRGTQPGIERSVAIKSIKSELANSPDFIRAFEAEEETIARLEHPHIVPLYDFWREPSAAYLVMRWLPAGSLADALSNGPLKAEEGVRIMEQVGSALTSAHAAGVVHRDVKPANIFLDEEGNGYLGDFGIAIETTNTLDPRIPD